ncbi:sensor histidine kinase [Enterococcus quebecensis]|uniref:histidine kinase n=1 Tax=Enterococcus quebecensis TaxID=903983 RepID=A0A1E5H3I7_9ENTE|nr:HAMP domain-containing sensor histidine kinase [Enterococcus quebecensis]OEG19567.1 hypothetical protein BCR23_02430 [Enterococcus quebecensis]OJG75155.1 hypothetical protein RV12_GL001760 [Enterococcus quebecensis]
MSLQKQITFLVSGLLICMSLIMLLFSVTGANKNFSVERLTRIDSKVVDSSVEKTTPALSPKEGKDLGVTLAKARISFSSSIAFVWLVVIIVGTFVTYKLVGKSLGSLVKLQKTMSDLDTRNIGKQIKIDQKQPQEVQALSMSYNDMTARLDESFLKQKNFVNNAAHELKTPLAVIITYAQLLQMNIEESDEESKKITDAILSSCDKLSITVEQLLLLANDNLLELTDSVSTDYLINDAFTELSLQAFDKEIRLKNKSSKNIQLRGNKIMLGVALKNLIENAVKYGDRDSVVTVSATASKELLTFEVRNSGQEILEEELERIFEPFYRGQKNNNQIIGNGLGLALVKKIIENHAGEVSCTVKGKEICFRFSIPIHK